ncbi:MAG: AAA family ATPase [Candidatus Paraimprobicoccus trichonymphae]|uniref:AAA family ATPase n=1 Tax=Candidatus Paraimprobicoccus trichonymphae TaxID=3033793 RepID=A0AA48KXK9_9FIRM|nr:MAG: AAA family ATPase [Candidatus Paraimprobicoccus trichonymphae]
MLYKSLKIFNNVINNKKNYEKLIKCKNLEEIYAVFLLEDSSLGEKEFYEFANEALESFEKIIKSKENSVEKMKNLKNKELDNVVGGKYQDFKKKSLAVVLASLTAMVNVGFSSSVYAKSGEGVLDRYKQSTGSTAAKEEDPSKAKETVIKVLKIIGIIASTFAIVVGGKYLYDNYTPWGQETENTKVKIKDIDTKIADLRKKFQEEGAEIDTLGKQIVQHNNERTELIAKSKENLLSKTLLATAPIQAIAGVVASGKFLYGKFVDLLDLAKKVNVIPQLKYTVREIGESLQDVLVPDTIPLDVTTSIKNLNDVFGYISGQIKAKALIRSQMIQYAFSRDSDHPQPTVLYFYGPSGVGKTQIASLLPFAVSEDPNPFVISASDIDLTQKNISYQLFFGVGSSSGRMNSQNMRGGGLCDYIQSGGKFVIINEYDKMWSPQLDEIFRKILDEGQFTVGGQKVLCGGVMFIITSNEYILRDGVQLEDKTKSITGVIPHDQSFMNRLTFIEFENLTAAEYEPIVMRSFETLRVSFKEKFGIKIKISNEVVSSIAQMVELFNQGARHIDKTFISLIRSKLLQKIDTHPENMEFYKDKTLEINYFNPGSDNPDDFFGVICPEEGEVEVSIPELKEISEEEQQKIAIADQILGLFRNLITGNYHYNRLNVNSAMIVFDEMVGRTNLMNFNTNNMERLEKIKTIIEFLDEFEIDFDNYLQAYNNYTGENFTADQIISEEGDISMKILPETEDLGTTPEPIVPSEESTSIEEVDPNESLTPLELKEISEEEQQKIAIADQILGLFRNLITGNYHYNRLNVNGAMIVFDEMVGRTNLMNFNTNNMERLEKIKTIIEFLDEFEIDFDNYLQAYNNYTGENFTADQIISEEGDISMKILPETEDLGTTPEPIVPSEESTSIEEVDPNESLTPLELKEISEEEQQKIAIADQILGLFRNLITGNYHYNRLNVNGAMIVFDEMVGRTNLMNFNTNNMERLEKIKTIIEFLDEFEIDFDNYLQAYNNYTGENFTADQIISEEGDISMKILPKTEDLRTTPEPIVPSEESTPIEEVDPNESLTPSWDEEIEEQTITDTATEILPRTEDPKPTPEEFHTK